jgi:hypothetical protein
MRTYNIFISHSWSYSDAYDRLINLFREASYFDYKDYSVSKDDPIHNANNSAELKRAIENQMKPTSVILILAGVYATYSKWINIEMEMAQNLKKPIIAIEEFGAQKSSQEAKLVANKIVKWNTDSIVSAIKELCD